MLLQPKQQHPGTAALLPGCFMETETGPPLVPGKPSGHTTGSPPAPCWRSWCLSNKALAPPWRLGATEQHPCVATEFATDEVESGALLVDNQLSCNIGNLADEFISAIYQHTQRPLDWQRCTI